MWGKRMPSKRGYARLDRVNEALREVIADELKLIDDDRLELVTITGVEAQADLRQARVWFSSLSMSKPGGEPGPERPSEREETGPERPSEREVASMLGEHRIRFQGSVARQLRLKRTPELSFQADPAIAVGTRVEDIIRGMKKPPPEGESTTP
jgi:ribosome-binding factor A